MRLFGFQSNSALEQAASVARPWQGAQRRQCGSSGPRSVPRPPLLTASVRHSWARAMSHSRVLIAFGIVAISAATPGRTAERFDACGRISHDGGCILFWPYAGAEAAQHVLPDTTLLAVGSDWRIVGDYRWYTNFCGYYSRVLENITISPCIPETLGCGVLWDFNPEYHCYAWTGLGDPGSTILVDGFDGFSLGDTVLATGIRDNTVGDICICACGLLRNATFTACGDTLTPVEKMSWGRVKALYRE
jgi:hypothetical protein